MSLKIRNWRIFVSPETNEPGKIIVNCTPNKYHYYTLYSLPVFSLTKSVQLIMEINVTYRLVGDLLADNSLICRLQGQCMIFKNNINSVSLRVCVCVPCVLLFSSKQCIIKQLLDSIFVIS